MNIGSAVTKKAETFLQDPDNRERVREGRDTLDEFRSQYNFRENPTQIDELRPADVYNPEEGETDYFFNWIEHRLSDLGRIFVWHVGPWQNAAEDLDRLKELLKIAVDDDRSIAAKIDAPWENIKGFGGDKHIAKKIVSVYYPDDVFPIFKTDHLETFTREIGLSPAQQARNRMNKDYDELTVGEKWELYNEILWDIKQELKPLVDEDNALFMLFLYDEFDVKRSSATTVTSETPSPLPSTGPLFEPSNELGVIALFAKYHEDLGFPYIVKVSDAFPDVSVIGDDGEYREIEFEYRSQNFATHNHDPEECDYVVCWIEDWGDPSDAVEIVSLKEKLEELGVY